MVTQPEYRVYTHSPFQTTNVGSREHVEGLQEKILKLSTNLNMSKYIDAASGAYSSTLHTLDIATKKYKKQTYEYGKELKLNKDGLIPTGLKFNDRTIQSHSESTNFYVSLNSSSAGGGSNYHAPSDSEILNANAYIENMDGTVLTIDIYGDFKLSVGMVINCRILKSIEGPNEKRGQDLYLSGKYIVASIDHRFADEYIMQVLLKKDSYIESLDKRIANS
jgi:hypothetical protein|tara:strand:+ start:126 stop:788 length:663 start_codon:yes stop_codon:yes gene_type:complete